ncbi:hypothetical protein CAC42_3072 [Sphaceloma murrayae]|uniref:SHSP domain-containing protein n=1 Tax=Sphaceloma murrayae TaxID=2082308 RepID=A0A2K1QRF9_9PEZI|nr:hypothetical protein CAC42_3072 [Sphaceloma murrayae]
MASHGHHVTKHEGPPQHVADDCRHIIPKYNSDLMQSLRSQTPQVYRIARATTPAHINTRKMSLFPRFTSGEFTPLFRLLDDYASHQLSRPAFSPSTQPSLRTFQPRFDVKESKEAYELEGELPGIDQKDVSIEFTDPQTLQIRGRTEKTSEQGTRPALEGQEQGRITDAGDKYHKPSVEDETTMSGANPDAESTEVSTETKSQRTPTHRYWVSERSVGEFSRSFNFPSRVDQDNVKASLKNGILSIMIPKASAPTSRKITIE